jgi:hypothetical protein
MISNNPGKKDKEDSYIKSFIRNCMVNLPGKNSYAYGKNVKKIFDELKKT